MEGEFYGEIEKKSFIFSLFRFFAIQRARGKTLIEAERGKGQAAEEGEEIRRERKIESITVRVKEVWDGERRQIEWQRRKKEQRRKE